MFGVPFDAIGFFIHQGGNGMDVRIKDFVLGIFGCSQSGDPPISMIFPLRNWEGYYAYSSRMRGKLCLLIGVRPL